MKLAVGDKTYMLCESIPHSRSEFRAHYDSLDLSPSVDLTSDNPTRVQRPLRVYRHNAPSPIEEEKKEASPSLTGRETGGEMEDSLNFESADVRQESG